jgi:hypothetical protein
MGLLNILSKNADIIFWGLLGLYLLFIVKTDTSTIVGTVCISTGYILHRLDKKEDKEPPTLE